MVFVYVLRSQTSGRFYIGCSENPQRRLAEHNDGETLSTRGRGPWGIVYQKSFATVAEARQFEAALKRKKSARYLEWLTAQSGERVPKAFGKVAGSNPAVPTIFFKENYK